MSFNSWIFLAVGDDRQHQGHDGYDDKIASHYSWDSSVARHDQVKPGDLVMLWDKKNILGLAVLVKIDTSTSEKIMFRCPKCRRTSGKRRVNKIPLWRCQKTNCQFEYTNPIVDTKEVKTYTGYFGNSWFAFSHNVEPQKVRSLQKYLKDQNSLRIISGEKLQSLMAELGNGKAFEKLEYSSNLVLSSL